MEKLIKNKSVTNRDVSEQERIYRNTNLKDLDNEIWVDCLGYDGLYEVSNLGRVKSLGRRVNNGQSGRWVKERILSPSKNKRDNRLKVGLSSNNKTKSFDISWLVFYSFNPKMLNDKINDEVYHKNKIADDNRLVNLGYNKVRGASYKISMELGNVKHLEKARKSLHKYTKETAIIKDGVITHRKCRVCKEIKPVNKFEKSRNTCFKCRWKKK
jgi:hypothetical protein